MIYQCSAARTGALGTVPAGILHSSLGLILFQLRSVHLFPGCFLSKQVVEVPSQGPVNSSMRNIHHLLGTGPINYNVQKAPPEPGIVPVFLEFPVIHIQLLQVRHQPKNATGILGPRSFKIGDWGDRAQKFRECFRSTALDLHRRERTRLLKCFPTVAHHRRAEERVVTGRKNEHSIILLPAPRDVRSFHAASCNKKALCVQPFQQHLGAVVLMLPSVKHHPNPHLGASQTNLFRGRRASALSHARAGARQPATQL